MSWNRSGDSREQAPDTDEFADRYAEIFNTERVKGLLADDPQEVFFIVDGYILDNGSIWGYPGQGILVINSLRQGDPPTE